MNEDINEWCAFGVMNCIKTLREKQDLTDFNVQVDGERFPCHRFILWACSPVFQGMLTSNFIEFRDGLATLHDISKDTFQSILTVLYTGQDILTKSNFIDVWKAAHMLQIDFLIKYCEDAASEFIDIDNFAKINDCATLFESKQVLEVTQKFIAENFNTVRRMQAFMKLSSAEVLAVVKRQDLAASSEEIVIEAVMDWANYYNDDPSTEEIINTNNTQCDAAQHKSRLESLSSLLKSTRLCLASPHFLNKLFRNDLVNSNNEAKIIIFNAVTYHLPNFRHGQWHSTAVHRDSSEFGQFGDMVTEKDDIEALSLDNEEWGRITGCSYLDTIVSLEVFQNKLYAYGSSTNSNQTSYSIYRLDEKGWKMFITVPGHDASAILIAHGDFMYILCKEAKKFYRNDHNYQEFMTLPPDIKFEFAFSFERFILAFFDTVINDKNETCVYILDISEKKWTQCDGFEGTAKHMISFRDDNDTYILQSDGSLRVVFSELSGGIEFRFLGKLWDFNKVLHGALIYNDCLTIFGNDPDNDPEDKTREDCLPERFEKIIYTDADNATSNAVPAILRKSLFFK